MLQSRVAESKFGRNPFYNIKNSCATLIELSLLHRFSLRGRFQSVFFVLFSKVFRQAEGSLQWVNHKFLVETCKWTRLGLGRHWGNEGKALKQP